MNLTKHLPSLLLLLCASFVTTAPAQVTYTGGKGLLRVWDAQPVFPGQLYLNAFYSGFFTPSGTDANGSRRQLEDHTLNIAMTLGLSRKFEIFGHFVPYQDDQKHLWGPIGDTRAGIKFMPGRERSVFQFGLLGFAQFATAGALVEDYEPSVPYEPFSSGKHGWGLLALINWDLNNAATPHALKISLNLGFRDHNWHDRYFTDDKDQLLCSLGIKFPIRTTVVYTELSGDFFINQTEVVPTKYNLMRFTQGFRFVGPKNLVFDIAGDVRLGSTPSLQEQASTPFIKEYADWKIVLGVTHRMTLFKYLTADEKLQRMRELEEQAKRETIKEKRQKVIQELEEMRRQLENEKKPTPRPE
ncbi:MAG TPA: hypothetical protein PKN04_12430 [bacterium]|mgnify:CR=1 FL=1|jgi:hypothetical protein|nr:hypothetical protein [bacterium]HNT66579.1 hypothetical protein [bacterium]HOX86387.1 hypothetical protein [bacterium]HPG45784.1 hypothetical protein [bacterium]HPM97989.1 hypothetical protein [bacterium]